jgi:hypothetical protein
MTDTLAFQLSKDTLHLTGDLAIKVADHNQGSIGSEWVAGIITIFVTIVTIIWQSILTRRTIKSDFVKIKAQIEFDFLAKSKFEWISSFKTIISNLLVVVDIDFRKEKELDGQKMAGLIFQAQLMLDDAIESEKQLASLLSKLGHHAVNAQIGNSELEKELLLIQAEVQSVTKTILKNK